MKQVLHYIRKTMYLPVFIAAFIIIAFIVDTPSEIITGYGKILRSTGILITDYIAVGGVGAAMLNCATIMIFYLIVLRLLNLRMTGIIFAGMMMIFGHSFYGKNIFNSLPIFFGVYLYSLVNHIHFKNVIVALLFSSGISPLVSYTMFGSGMPLYYGVPVGILVGIASGFILPALASHTMKFHQGYSVYNSGFALGLISIFFNAIYQAFGDPVETVLILDNRHNWMLVTILVSMCLFYIIMSFVVDRRIILKFKELFKRSGRLITDFERDYGVEAVIINTAMLILLEVIVIVSLGIKMDGPIFGAIISGAGFAGAGLHLKNCFPVLIGALAVAYVSKIDLTSTSGIIAVIFALGLAPICGRYGVMAGLIAGGLHIMLTRITVPFQGGFVLYNSGFASCFVASLMISFIEAIKEDNHA